MHPVGGTTAQNRGDRSVAGATPGLAAGVSAPEVLPLALPPTTAHFQERLFLILLPVALFSLLHRKGVLIPFNT